MLADQVTGIHFVWSEDRYQYLDVVLEAFGIFLWIGRGFSRCKFAMLVCDLMQIIFLFKIIIILNWFNRHLQIEVYKKIGI